MHIPDGMLSTPVSIVADVGAVGLVAYAVGWVNRNLDQKKVVLMSVLGALIFALQMLNFAVAGGTSGHFGGGALAGILLGPWAASIVMTSVLAIQAIFFKDGGVVALGANVLNLGIIAPFIGYALYNLAVKIKDNRTGRVVGSFVAAWASLLVAALAVGLELWLSGHANLALIMGSMGGWHAIIGIGEGLITAGLVSYLITVRPDLLGDSASKSRSSMKSVLITLVAIAIVGASLSFLASSKPDGLEYVYFEEKVGAPIEEFSLVGNGGPLAGYGFAGVSSEALGGALAGIIGLTLTGSVLYVAFSRRKKNVDKEQMHNG